MREFLRYLREKDIEHTVVDGCVKVLENLDLRGVKDVKSLPDDLYVRGRLDLERSHFKTLPRELYTTGYLDIRGSNITKLPDNMSIGGDLYLDDQQIEAFPRNLYVGADLSLYGTKLTSLPEDLRVELIIKHHFFEKQGSEITWDRSLSDYFGDVENPTQDEIAMLELMTGQTWLYLDN